MSFPILLISLLLTLTFTSEYVQGTLETEILTSFNSYCKAECTKLSDGRHSCQTEDKLDPWGWDWCSPRPGLDYREKPCNPDHCCGHHGKNYNWCFTQDGSWGYCSPQFIYLGISQRDWQGRRCVNPCDIIPGKSADYFWCLAIGYGWSSCSPMPETTIRGQACRANHKCGSHGKSYFWCFIDDNDNWDYCGIYEDISELRDFDDWQFIDGAFQPVRQLMYGSSINSVSTSSCQSNNTQEDDKGVITVFEIPVGSAIARSHNEAQRRNAFSCIANFRRSGQPLPHGTNSSTVSQVGDGSNVIRLDVHVHRTVRGETGEPYLSLELSTSSPSGSTTIGTCVISQRLALESPRFVSMALSRSLEMRRVIRVIQRRVQRRYRRPGPG